ncbi:hypothetical protein C8Q77DRAFT_1235304 [Trametes polyzona]|nr:hypothetical protein C8Q77DRAFT_1235304 [Trametes polyzona]
MSDNEYAAQVQTLVDESYETFAAFALLAFEYVITFDREVRLVWGRKVTGATILFVLNRYWLFFQYVTQVVTTYPISQHVTHSCDIVGRMIIVGNAGPPFIWAAFSALRGYALSGRKWWIGILIALFYIPDIVINCIYYSGLTPIAVEPPFNCLLAADLSETTWIHFVISSRVCLIVGDLIVLIVTWHSTFGITRAAKVANIRMSLTNAILKDGECLLILNVVNIIINAVPNLSAVSAFQDPITSILVSRFLLNLRDTVGGGGGDGVVDCDTRPSFVRSARHARPMSTNLQFAEFVDSMGADLDHSLSETDSVSRSVEWSEVEDLGGGEATTGNELSSLSASTSVMHSSGEMGCSITPVDEEARTSPLESWDRALRRAESGPGSNST